MGIRKIKLEEGKCDIKVLHHREAIVNQTLEYPRAVKAKGPKGFRNICGHEHTVQLRLWPVRALSSQ